MQTSYQICLSIIERVCVCVSITMFQNPCTTKHAQVPTTSSTLLAISLRIRFFASLNHHTQNLQ
eukprot:m.368820 g.368820  ORF g.368820 m.368820 type:complete len:64 (+) comp46591_c0_seq1:63-254(+)